MNKKMSPHIIAVGALVIFIVLGLACASTPKAPDVSKALTPTGLSIDPDNCAYLIGPILAIDNNNVTGVPFSINLDGKTVRVPIGKQLNVSITVGLQHNYRRSDGSWATDIYDTNYNIIIPALENGRIYRLVTTNYNINENEKLLLSFEVDLIVFNTETNRYEHIYNQKVNLNPPVRPK